MSSLQKNQDRENNMGLKFYILFRFYFNKKKMTIQKLLHTKLTLFN